MGEQHTQYTCTDHLGQTFPNLRSMAEHYGISPSTLKTRLYKGMNLKDALTTPTEKYVVDHKGNVYSSLLEMAKQYGISYRGLHDRLKNGIPIGQALTKPLRKLSSQKTDYNGQSFATQAEMAKAYSISAHLLASRLQDGMPLEKALTQPKQYHGKTYDHNRNEYSSFDAMCKAYGQVSQTVRNRLKKGIPLQEALEKETKHGHRDHHGNYYQNLTDMLAVYNITKSAYKNRKDRGWTLEKILTTPILKRKQTSQEILQKALPGTVKKMRNGLSATILKYIDKNHVHIRFEDGVEKITTLAGFQRWGKVGHPDLLMTKQCEYHGFSVRFVTATENDTFYQCTCKQCGKQDILTPQQMLIHKCTIGDSIRKESKNEFPS